MNLPAETLAWLAQRSSKGMQKLALIAVSAPKMARLPARLDGTALMILNRDELLAATGHVATAQTDWPQLARQLLQRGAENVLVTAGEHGVWGVQKDAEWHLPALPVEVRDVTGAGDAFSAGVITGLMRAPQDLQAAAQRGLQLAALTLQSEQTVAGDLHPAIFE
jgi:pseudouridine kinase